MNVYGLIRHPSSTVASAKRRPAGPADRLPTAPAFPAQAPGSRRRGGESPRSAAADVRKPQVAIQPIDRAVIVGVALLPRRARESVRKPDRPIQAVHHAVQVEVAGIRGHDLHLVRSGVVEAPQRQSRLRRGRIAELAHVPTAAVIACLQQASDRRRRIRAADIVEDDCSRPGCRRRRG